MFFLARGLSFLLLVTAVLSATPSVSINDAVINKKVDRTIDLSSQLVTITCRVVIENSGKTAVDKYLITIDNNEQRYLAYLEANLVKKDGGKVSLSFTKLSSQDDVVYWQADLSKNPIPSGSSVDMDINAVFTHLLKPYPSEITQAERQLVLYNGNHYFLSPYITKTQTTRIKLPSSGNLESYSKLKPSSVSDHTINYGPYEKVAPNSISNMKIHVENNTPFLTVARLERNIEVSHWAGVISVEESIELHHDGAILKGPFSRYEFQREPTNGMSAVKSFRTKLPASAFDIYYRDEIGNISTSNIRKTSRHVIADLRPRFPLFGGWKTHYTVGYHVPTAEYLSTQGSQFLLRMPFIDHIFDNSVIDEAIVSISLPEGSSNIEVRLPYSVNREKDQVYKSYLDTVGRTKIVLRKTNLVEKHIQDLEVQYNYNLITLLQEPLLIVVALFILCLTVSIYVRMDFSLGKSPIKESTIKVGEIVDSILSHNSKRTQLYQRYDQASAKVKATKNMSIYHSTIKQVNQDLKQEASAIGDLTAKIKSENAPSELIEKLNEIQKLDKSYREQLTQQSTLIEKLIAGRINKQLFMETDANINKKKAEYSEKMLLLASNL